MSLAAAVLAAQLLTARPQATARTDSWTVISKAEAEAARKAHADHEHHLAHLAYEQILKQKAPGRPQEGRSVPVGPFSRISSSLGGYAPSAPAPAPSGGDRSNPADLAFQACVISAESGGNPNIWNGSGHYGLYQFDEGTWVAYDGPASEFGDATVSEQDQVFWNVMEAGMGYSTWSEWDNCPAPANEQG